MSVARGATRSNEQKLATLFLWLIVALTTATFQALWNYDDLYQVGPFVKLSAGLVKKQV